jgi:hypothetical protein
MIWQLQEDPIVSETADTLEAGEKISAGKFLAHGLSMHSM